MKNVKCDNMAELNEAIKEKVNLDLTNWTDGNIDLRSATTDNIDLENAKTGDINLQYATTDNINLKNATTGNIDLENAKTGNIDLRSATTDNIDLQGAKTGDIHQNYTDEDLDFLRNLPLDIIDMKKWQSNDNWLMTKDIHTCGTTYCLRGYAEAQYFAKNEVKVKNVESLYPNLKHLFFMTNEQFKAELNKIL